MGCDMVGAPSAPPNSHWAQQQQMGERGRPCRHSLFSYLTYCQPLRLASSHFVEFTPPTQPPSTPSCRPAGPYIKWDWGTRRTNIGSPLAIESAPLSSPSSLLLKVNTFNQFFN